jgi:calcium-dependent protein kinase
VLKAYRKDDTNLEQKFAVKKCRLGTATPKDRAFLEQECDVFLSMDHPHIARLVDIYDDEESGTITLVMECMEGGELLDRLLERKKFSEKDAAIAAYQMLRAINYLHSHGIVHRDIKLENFLYESDSSDHLKLIDFGFSKQWSEAETMMKEKCGTLSYVAPEVLSGSYTSKCDMWSLGVTVFILLSGYMPFSGSDEKQGKDIRKGTINWKAQKWGAVSEEANEFVRNLLSVDANKRMSAEEALEHPWIEKANTWMSTTSMATQDESLLDGRASIVSDMMTFARESKFKRACMLAMAWSLPNEEQAKLRSAFMAMDKNNQGTITLAEFKSAVREHFHLNDEKVVEVFSALDSANNSEIQFTEFLAAMVSSRMHKYGNCSLKTAFKKFDTDRSGFITKTNLKDVLGDTVHDLDEIMHEVDSSIYGKISVDEFENYVKTRKVKRGSTPASFSHAASTRQRAWSTMSGPALCTRSCVPRFFKRQPLNTSVHN